MKDLELDQNYKRGDSGKKCRLIQEWLCLHGTQVSIDGDFGPATEFAVREFQKSKKLSVDGVVGKKTFSQLVLPMKNAIQLYTGSSKNLGQVVVQMATQHLKEHPREVGGQNRGPWVRLYMKGNEGKSWPWCAGFASHVLKQACDSIGVKLPLGTSFSCDLLSANAKGKGLFLGEKQVKNVSQITPGSLFLVRRTSKDWVHTGIVVKAEDEFFMSIEGNTNDEGSREGYEVCKRTRGYKNKDFILTSSD